MKILGLRNCYTENPARRRADGYGGCGYYRMIKPAEEVAKVYDIDVWGRKFTEIEDTIQKQWTYVFTHYDVIWTRYFDSAEVASWLFSCRDYFSKKLNKEIKVIVDIDDNYLDVDKSNPQYKVYEKGRAKRAHVGALFSLADAITVSTEPLKERYQRHIKELHGIDKPIYVIPNCNDIKDWDFKPAIKNPTKITIGYTGSVSHDDDLKLVLPAIKNLMEKYKNLHFQLLGIVQKGKVKVFFNDFTQEMLDRIDLVGATEMFTQYPEWLSKQTWDIGIAPLCDTAFTRCKSHIKWMEYAMYKIPCVASRVYPYFMDIYGKETIIDDETGLLCEPHEWEKQLERLILDEELRKRIGENAYNEVKDKWQYSNSGIKETWRQIESNLFATKENL